METLEQEFTSRVFVHMTAIVGGYIMNEYIKKNENSYSPDEVYDEANKITQEKLAHACATGTLDKLYKETWEKIKDTLPEHTNVVNPVDEEEIED